MSLINTELFRGLLGKGAGEGVVRRQGLYINVARRGGELREDIFSSNVKATCSCLLL